MSGPLGGPMGGTAIVLGGGGVLGAAWMSGALQALVETGLDPGSADLLIGTSAGSVLAAALGCGVPVTGLVEHQSGPAGQASRPPLPRPGFGSPRLLVRGALAPWTLTPTTALAGLLPRGRGSLAEVGALIEEVLPAGARWAPHPATWVVAMDHGTGRRTVFGRPGSPPADLPAAVMASCAIPGWFAPQQIGGRRYVDGGSCSPTSLDLVLGAGCDTVYLLAPTASLSPDQPQTVAARIERGVRRSVTRRLLRDVARVRRTGAEVVVLCPGPDDLAAIGGNLMDPRRRERVLDTALRTSRVALADAAVAS